MAWKQAVQAFTYPSIEFPAANVVPIVRQNLHGPDGEAISNQRRFKTMLRMCPYQ